MALSKFERARRQSIQAHLETMEYFADVPDQDGDTICGFCEFYRTPSWADPFDIDENGENVCRHCPIQEDCRQYLDLQFHIDADVHMAALLYLFDLKENTNGNA
jgi:hypothetical protein